MLADLEAIDREDPSYPIQRSLVAGYAALGSLVCETREQYHVEALLDGLEAAVRSGDLAALSEARFSLKAYVYRAERLRGSVLSAAIGLRSAAERVVEEATRALRDCPEPPTPPSEPAG